jgi:hypothetical protein
MGSKTYWLVAAEKKRLEDKAEELRSVVEKGYRAETGYTENQWNLIRDQIPHVLKIIFLRLQKIEIRHQR